MIFSKIEISDSVDMSGNVVTGDFILIKYAPSTKRDKVVAIKSLDDDRYPQPIAVHVYEKDCVISDGTYRQGKFVTKNDLLSKILERFTVMNILTEAVIHGNVRSYIMSGSAGIGKSYNLLNRLEKALESGEINKYEVLKGRVSAVCLYAKLFEYSEPGNILILDDIDVFSDENTLEILKGALDTNSYRRISWSTQNRWLIENDIPLAFDFEGAAIFVTNKNLDVLGTKNGPVADHIKALISRSVYLDLLIHEPYEIMTYSEHVVKNSSILDKYSLNEDQVQDLMDWMWANYLGLRTLSLRTFEHIGNFIHTDPRWEMIANSTMVRRM